jgi:tripartite ATP-independent transporter DctP family solute receptor
MPASPLSLPLARRDFLLSTALGAGALATSLPAFAQALHATRVRMTMDVSPKEPLGVAMEFVVREAEKRSGGAVKIDFFPSGQLGQDLATFEQLSAGTVNVHASGFGINANYNSFFAPWLFNDFAHVERVLESPLAQQWNADLVKTRGVSVLMAYPRAPRQMTNSKRAIRTPDDLKGLKLRVPEIPILFNAFKGLGAEPVAMNFGEVYTALQSGTIEGQENPLPTIVGFSLQEVQKFVSLTEHVRAPEFIYVNARWWTGLDPRVRELLSTLFAEGKKIAAQAIVEQQQTNLAAIRKANAAINEVDQAAFRTRARPVLDRIGPQFLGADTYAAIVRAAT